MTMIWLFGISLLFIFFKTKGLFPWTIIDNTRVVPHDMISKLGIMAFLALNI